MKTKTMRKALSLFLAVLMIALALPLTLLTASAEETTTATSATIKSGGIEFYGWKNDGSKLTCFGSYPLGNAIDGKVENDKEAYTNNASGLTKNVCVGVGGISYKKGEGDFYGVFVIELSEISTLDTITISTPYAPNKVYFANDGYDIYYSVDGNAIKAVDGATFTNMTGDGTTAGANSSLYKKISDELYVHEIDMKDVTAKYVYVAVTDTCKNDNKNMMLAELSVDGTVVNPTPATIKRGGIEFYGWKNDGSQLKCFGSYPLGNAIDGKVENDKEAYTNNASGLTKNVCFGADGISYKKGEGDFYGIFVIELNEISTLNAITISTPYTPDKKYFANDGYDIYYSVDGVLFEAVDGATFTNMTGDGTTAGANSNIYDKISDELYVHEIDMKDVTAKYVAVAVTATCKNDNKNMMLAEISVDGTIFESPVSLSVAGLQQNTSGGVRLVGVTNSTKAAGVGFKLDVTHTYEEAAESIPASFSSVSVTMKKGNRNDDVPVRFGSVEAIIDGDKTFENPYSYYQSYNIKEYNPSYYLDDENKIARDTSGTAQTYHGYAMLTLSNVSELNSVTVWLAGDTAADWSNPANSWGILNAYDVLVSEDGETWTLVGEYSEMCGNKTNAGANFPKNGDDAYDTRTGIEGALQIGVKTEINGLVAKYVAIGIKAPSNSSKGDAVIGEVTVDGTVVADTITVTKTATIDAGSTNTVYNSILADGVAVTAKDIDATLYDENDKLYALGITGVPTNGTVTLEVTPYFIPVGSTITKIFGDTATFEFIEGKAFNKNETVKVMSYNINNGQVNDKIASARLDYIAAQINTVDPDIVILNEAHNYENHFPSYDINTADLTKKCDVNYGIVEFTGNESSNVILYNTEKYTLLKSECLELGYGKADSYDAAWKRDAVIAKLKRISDNREIVAVSTHISESNYGTQLWDLLTHVRDNYGDVEYRIVAGDINIQNKDLYGDGSSTGHKGRFENSGCTDIPYVDANVSANGTTDVDTTPTFPDPEKSKIIDYIYTTNFTAKDYQVLSGGQASNASDHNAVYAELTLN